MIWFNKSLILKVVRSLSPVMINLIIVKGRGYDEKYFVVIKFFSF